MSFEICAVLGYYVTWSGNSLLTFWDNPSFPFSRVENPDPGRWDRYVVLKYWYGITTTHCIISQKNMGLIYFSTEA